MQFEEYQEACAETAIYPSAVGLPYTILGLTNEAGELAGVYKKVLRDNHGVISHEYFEKLRAEAGDVLWYLAMICNEMGMSLETVATENILKLKNRQERGVLRGSGDTR